MLLQLVCLACGLARLSASRKKLKLKKLGPLNIEEEKTLAHPGFRRGFPCLYLMCTQKVMAGKSIVILLAQHRNSIQIRNKMQEINGILTFSSGTSLKECDTMWARQMASLLTFPTCGNSTHRQIPSICDTQLHIKKFKFGQSYSLSDIWNVDSIVVSRLQVLKAKKRPKNCQNINNKKT